MKQPSQPRYLYPHEVFGALDKIDSFHERVKFLQDKQSFSIRTILQCNFTPSIILDLPDGSPPFQRDVMPLGNSLGRVDKAVKVLGSLVAPGGVQTKGLGRMKKETRFIQLLESVNEKDADVIIAMKDKELTKMYPVLDRTLAKAAFPNLFG
jgi:hypothetical protein